MSSQKTNVVPLPKKDATDKQVQEALEQSSRTPEKHEAAVRQAYDTYTSYGWKPVLLYPGRKRPIGNNWLDKPAPGRDDFIGHSNIGVANGEKSGGLVDLDIDDHALLPILAKIMPKTGARFGRYNNTDSLTLSHWLYRSSSEKSFVIKKPGGGVMAELRSNGGQTVFPGSLIYDNEHHVLDLVSWEGGPKAPIPALETITEVPFDVLRRRLILSNAILVCSSQFSSGSFHLDMLAWCGLLAKAGYDKEEARWSVELLVEMTGQKDLEDRLAALDDTYEKFQQGENISGISVLKDSGWDEKVVTWLRNLFKVKSEIESDGRPQVRVVASKETQLYDDTLAAMIASRKFYSFGGQIVVINREGGGVMPVTAKMVPLADSIAMGAWLTREVQFIQSTIDKTTQTFKDALIKAPPSVSSELANAHTYRGDMPQITGVSNIPAITATGRIVEDQWGYDQELKLFFSCRYPVKRMHPDEALAVLKELFADFPFSYGHTTDDPDLPLGERFGRYFAAAISIVLAGVARPAMDICPAYVTTSSQWGDGKSVLCNAAAAALGMEGGTANSPLTRGGSDEEQEKQISSVLAKGKRVIIYDNHDGEFRSSALTETLTSAVPEFRILGKSEVRSVPNRSMFMMNGVNMVLPGDLQTRSVMIRLARSEVGALRKFKHLDLTGWAFDNSDKLVSAAISLIEWALRQDDGDWRPTHRFKRWDLIVRRSIMLACGVDIAPPAAEDTDRIMDPVEEVKHDFLQWVLTLWEGGMRDKGHKNWIRGRTLADVVGTGSVQEGWINSICRRPNQSLDIKIGRCLNAVKDYPFTVGERVWRVVSSNANGVVVYRLEQLV